MKPQDIIFFVVLIALLLSRRPKVLVWAGLGSLVLAVPLFSFWIFFTAERLTWYAAAFFLTYILISLMRPHTVQ